MTSVGDGPRLEVAILANLQVPDRADYGLQLGFAFGGGPATVFLGPQQGQEPFSLRALVEELATILGIAELGAVGRLTGAKPWNRIFDVEISPTLTVQLADVPAVQLVLDLFEDGKSGVRLPGGTMPDWLTIEPDFTVYSLIVGYHPDEGGLQLQALVEFEEQASAQAIRESRDTEPAPAKQLVSFPFPVPPTGTPNLEVKYLGLGQRFGPVVDVNAPDPIAAMFTELESTFVTNDPATLVNELADRYYAPDRNWFIGAHVLVRGWEIRAVFNDPVLYGLEVTCSTGTFAGLLLEILYQKLGPGLGVYYGELTLPTAFRTVQLGVVSLTIPSFRIWIYTNGDFKISVGWPLGPNSIGVQVYIFTGGGGFYFAKLRTGDKPASGLSALATANSTVVGEVLCYNPILEFGLGAWFGLGRSISSGPFSAALSLTLQGTFQGVLAWEGPEDGSSTPSSLARAPDYYWFAATVSLVGELQGSVDLKVIKLSVLVRLSLTAGVAFETGYATSVLVSASVKVQATVKVLFVKVSVGFSTTITQTFQLSGGKQPAATIDHPNNPAFRGLSDWGPRGLPALEQAICAQTRPVLAPRQAPLPFPIPAPGPQVVDLGFLLQPTARYDGPAGVLCAVASLTIGCPPPVTDSVPPAPTPAVAAATEPQTPLETLLAALGAWLLRTYAPAPHDDWAAVLRALGEGEAAPPEAWLDQVRDFLREHIRFVLHAVDLTVATTADQHVAFFPMFPDLSLQHDGGTVDFADQARTPAAYAAIVAAYFAELSLSDGGTELLDEVPEHTDVPAGPALAWTILEDYLLTVSRQLARECHDPQRADGATIAANVGGMASRYLLSGIRLPDPASVPPDGPMDPDTLLIEAGHALTGQQFPIDTDSGTCAATLRIGPDPSPLVGCLTFAGDAESITSLLPVQPLPAPPDPTWRRQATELAGRTFTIEPVPAGHSVDRVVAVRTRLPWTAPTGTQSVVPLPPAVLSESSGRPVHLAVTENTDEHREHPVTPMLLIPVTLRRVHRSRSVNVVPDGAGVSAGPESPHAAYVYRVDGTDDQTRDRIESALRAEDFGTAVLHVLYDAPQGGYLSDQIDLGRYPVLLAKTNLSTTSQPQLAHAPLRLLADVADAAPSAALDSATDFLRLLWEVSVVRSEGTYLHYQNAAGAGLPDNLFDAPGSETIDGVPTGDTATVTIAVTFPEQHSVRRWHNAVAVDLDPAYDGTLLLGMAAEGGTIQDLSPSYPPGCLAFRGRWGDEHLLRAKAVELYSEDWVSHLYQLIQFQVTGDRQGTGPGFRDSLWSLALTPLQEGSAEEHTYRQVVPVHRFATHGADNPYAAVGGSPRLTLRVLDVFGNSLDSSAHEEEFPVLYNDPLWSPAEWPGVRIAYRFAPGESGPTLDLNLEFDLASVVRTGPTTMPMVVHGMAAHEATDSDKDAQQAEVALRQYALVVAQLSDPRTRVALRCTALPSMTHTEGLADELLQFAQSAAALLEQQLTHGRAAGESERLAVRLAVPIDPHDLSAATEDILELRTTLELSRPAELVFTDPAGQTVPRSQFHAATLAADLDPPPSGTVRARTRAASTGEETPSDVALTRFAEDLEGVFAGFDRAAGHARLAIRTGTADLAVPDPTALWLIRWSDRSGVEVQVDTDQASYFALAPLSPNLEGGEALVPTFDRALSDPERSRRTFSHIDLDVWAAAALSSIDGLLTPQAATAIAWAAPQAYEDLMMAKSVLAKCLAAEVQPVYQAGAPHVFPGDLAAARAQLEQSSLASLSTAYATASIVQVPAVVHRSNPDRPGPPASRLFGGVEVMAEASRDQADLPSAAEVSVSSLKVPLGPTTGATATPLTLLLSVDRPTTAANLRTSLRWHARFVEHLLPGADGGYQPSEWLRVVSQLPGDPFDIRLGSLDLPIPQRRFPSTPRLGTQCGRAGEAPAATSDGPSATDPLAAFLRWEYAADITLDQVAAQDVLWVNTIYNTPLAQLPTGLGEEPSLFQALASFVTAWPQLEPHLQGLADGSSEPAPEAVIAAVLAEVRLVASAWAHRAGVPTPWAPGVRGPRLRASPDPVPEIVDTYQVDFGEAYARGRLTVWALAAAGADGEGDPDGIHWPVINGRERDRDAALPATAPADQWAQTAPGGEPGWSRATYEFTPPDPGQPCNISLQWVELDALERQTGRLEGWVTRNARLSGPDVAIPTNPAFVYRTPEVSFPNPVVPRLSVPKVGPLDAGEGSLAARLAEVLTAIGRAGAVAATTRVVKVGLSYRFELPGSAGQIATSPVLLADHLELSVGTDSGPDSLAGLCEELDATSQAWYRYYRPSTDQGTLSVFLVLFLDVSGTLLPVLQVDDLQLTVPHDWWPAD